MNILYLCTGNSCRSQMAEAWTRLLRPEISCWSAGVERHGMNPYAVKVMEEAGADMSAHSSKLTTELPDVAFDYIVTLCGHAAENCPFFPGAGKRVHRGFDDPPSLVKGLTDEKAILDVYRRVRDEIRVMVEGVPGSLDD